jgi:ELWxxDGT repeat protein
MRFGADGDGNIWANWFSGFSGSRHVNIAAFDGTAWSSQSVATSNTGDYYNLALAVSAGEVVVSWNLGSTSLKTRRFDLATGTWGPERTIFTGGQQMQNTMLAQTAATDFYLTFMKRSAIETNRLLPFYIVSTNGGDTWSSPVQLAPSSRQNFISRPVADSKGVVTILWQEQFPNQRPKSTVVASTGDFSDKRELYQVAEINPGPSHALIYDMAELNGKFYVIARSDTTGFELFELDGTELNLVEDLYPGVGNGLYDTTFVAKTPTALYFQGTDGVTGYELYKFDGTSISLVVEINPAQTTVDQTQNQLSPGSSPGSDGASALLGNLLFLNASYPSASTGYVIDLSADPIVAVKLTDYFVGFGQSSLFRPVVIGSNLYFRAGNTIYQTNGVDNPVEVPGTSGRTHFSLGAFGTKLLIGASPTGTNQDVELMVWDPSNPTAPAALAANINTFDAGGDKGSYPVGFATRCNEVYFTASSGFAGVIDNRELWKWDGYEATLAMDFWPGTAASDSGRPFSITPLGDEIFVFANDGVNGTEPWIIRGNQASLIEDFRPGSQGSVSGSPPMFVFNNQVYLPLWGDTGIELYTYGVKPANHTVATYAPSYSVTFDANGGTGSTTIVFTSGNITLDSGADFALPNKELLGWDTDPSATTPT